MCGFGVGVCFLWVFVGGVDVFSIVGDVFDVVIVDDGACWYC